MTTLSIIVCTYNRAALLDLCLSAINKALLHSQECEVLVVDNGSTDHTKTIVEKHQLDFPIKYVVEKQTGLSYARNAGAKIATGSWLLYLDDDGMIDSDCIAKCLSTIEEYGFKMFTGIYRAWHRNPAPGWFPEYIGNYKIKGPLKVRAIGTDFVSGGIMAIEKTTLESVGLFPTNLGMSGSKLAYGEETYVEQQLRNKDIAVGINPFMTMDHLVTDHKYSLRWVLRSAFASKRDAHSIIPYPNSTAWKSIIKIGWYVLTGLPKSIIIANAENKLDFKRVLLCWLRPIAEEYGKIYAIFKSKF